MNSVWLVLAVCLFMYSLQSKKVSLKETSNLLGVLIESGPGPTSKTMHISLSCTASHSA